MDNETLILLYERMLKAVQLMQLSSEEQTKYLGKSSVDDIALTFDSNVTIHANNFLKANIITSEQFDLIMKINDKLDKMSDDKDIWARDKLDEVQWCECRVMARELLVKLKENDIETFINENLH